MRLFLVQTIDLLLGSTRYIRNYDVDPILNVKDSFQHTFRQDGFWGPVDLLSETQAHFLGRHLMAMRHELPIWHKSLATLEPLVWSLATSPKLLNILRNLIGEDIILWGSSYVARNPGDNHPWHCDIESSSSDGGFASVWIGLLNTTKNNSLRVVPHSHQYGATIQELSARRSLPRSERNDDAVLRLAQSFTPTPSIKSPVTRNGQAIIFDGRLWHSTTNEHLNGARVALLLQYAKSNRPVRVPYWNEYEWPFQYTDRRAPVISVCGQSGSPQNDVWPAPTLQAQNVLWPRAYTIDGDLQPVENSTFQAIPGFLGSTPNAEFIESHYSVLMPGASPHAPHVHREEEILVVMKGRGELIVPRQGQVAGGEEPQIRQSRRS